MKKIIGIYLMIAMMMSMYNVDVYAALSEVSNLSSDSNVGEQTYSFDIISIRTKYNDGVNGYIYKVNGTITFDGYNLCAYREKSSDGSVMLNLYVYNSNGYVGVSYFLGNLSTYRKSMTGSTQLGKSNLQSLNFIISGENCKENEWFGCLGDLKWDQCDYVDEYGKCNTNMPIFETQDQAISFMNGDLSVKDAFNYDTDLCNVKYDLEIPQEMTLDRPDDFIDKLTGESSDYTFSWKQTDKNYVHWDTQFFYYIDIYAFEGFLSFEVGDGKRFNDEFVYADKVATYKLKFVKEWETIIDSDEYDAIWARINAEYPTYTSSTIKTYKVYIRNSYYDGDIQHYSNWVYVEIDTETDNVSIVELAGNTDDTPGTSTPGKDVTGSVVEDSIYDGSIQNAASSSGDILNYVSNGFGFTGEGGIIDMIAEGFSFIPGDFWTVFLAGIGIMVMIAVFKFARG